MVWLGCMSITMLFAGLISAYVVQSSDRVWVTFNMPKAFIVSTVVIILSSIMLYLALLAARKNNKSAITLFLALTFLGGVGFTVFQFKGWGQLVDAGNFVADSVVNDKAPYGREFSFEYKGQPIEHDGQNYRINDEVVTEEQLGEIRALGFQLCGKHERYHADAIQYKGIEGYQIRKTASGELLEFNGKEIYRGTTPLTNSEKDDLFKFGYCVYNGMEYFILTGKYGKDFSLIMDGEKLDFENKKFYYPEITLTDTEKENMSASFIAVNGKQCKIENGKIIDPQGNVIPDNNLNTDFTFAAGKSLFTVYIVDGAWIRERTEVHEDDYSPIIGRKNTASSYLWAITVLHFLHLFGGLIYLLSLFIKALNKRFDAENHRNIKTGGIYWHYLGGLWLILFFFFQYIH